MGKRSYRMTRTKRERWIREGRGQREGCDYKPWFRVANVPSIGNSSRVKGWKTNRKHNFLSGLELSYFYHLEWSDTIIDIREQFPLLPLEETVAIAAKLGIRHPKDYRTKEYIVMTTDFMLTVRDGIRKKLVARTVKLDTELLKQRVREKLLIEKVFYKRRKVDWGVITESGLSETLARNVGWVHRYYYLPPAQHRTFNDEVLAQVIPCLTEQVLASTRPLTEITKAHDQAMQLRPGSSLAVAKHLIATKYWKVDMHQPVHPNEPLKLLSVGR